jgi:Tfp pilus assembly protein PilZ
MATPLGRRRYSRARVRWPVTLLTSQNKTEGKTENVCPSGVFITCREVSISEGSLRLVIKVPGHQPINVAGKVVWSKLLGSSEGVPSLGMGVQFTKISENDSHFLREVILKRYGRMIKGLIDKNRRSA